MSKRKLGIIFGFVAATVAFTSYYFVFAAGSSSVTVVVPPGTAAGSYNVSLVVNGTGSDGLSKQGTINTQITVQDAPPGMPTASLTANNSDHITVIPGQAINYEWASTGGTSWSADYASSGSCLYGGSGPWSSFNGGPSGSANDTVITGQEGCTYTITFRVSNASGTATDNVNVVVVAGSINGACGPTANSCSSGTLANASNGQCSYTWQCVGQSGGTTASCSYNKANGLSCSDGNSCTTGDFCTSGSCVGGTNMCTAPDLSAGINPPNQNTATVGVNKLFYYTVYNMTGGSVTTPFYNLFQIYNGPNGSGSAIYSNSKLMEPLTAGGQRNDEDSYTFPSAGVYSIRVWADKSSPTDTGTITESNEGNNWQSTWTNVTVSSPVPPSPDPAVVSITATPANIPYNSSSNISWLYSNATSCTIDPQIATISLYPSGSGGSSTGNLTASRTYTISCNPPDPSSVPSSVKSVTVNVEPAPGGVPLNIIKAGQGTVTSTSDPAQANINCGTSCGVSYTQDTEVTLTATPNQGRIFTGWGGDCSGTPKENSCNLTMNSGKTVIVNFVVDPSFGEF
jgi:hypothetical protein